MIYFIYGQDNFRSGEYLKFLLNFYQQKNPFYFSFDFSDKLSSLDFNEIKEVLGSHNLFATTRLIVFKNLFNSTEVNFQKTFLDTVFKDKIDQSKSTMLILYENQSLKDKNILKLLKQKVKLIKEFELLKGLQLTDFIEKESQKLGIKLSSEAKDLLKDSFGSDTGLIYYALKKLSLVSKGLIGRQELEENIWLPVTTNIFHFLDALAAKKIPLAFNLLMKEIEKDNSPSHILYLLKMIIYEFRNILMIKEIQNKSIREIQEKLEINQYTLRKTYPLVKNFSFEELKQIYQKLLLCDERMKTSSLGHELALQILLLDIKQILC